MNFEIGKEEWAIAEGYIPGGSSEAEPEMSSRETICILNASNVEAIIRIYVYFSDREPAGPYKFTIPPRRTKHVCFNDLQDPEPIPRDADYASVLRSNTPVIIQHSRLDSRQVKNALLSTIAYGE